MPLLTPEEEAAGGRLPTYNERDNTPANPRGFGRGGSMPPVNLFMAALRDFVTFGGGVVRSALEAVALIEERTAEFQIAAVIAEGGPVRSVTIGDSEPQTGDVHINLDAISAEVLGQLEEVREAQAALEAAQAAIRDDAQSYALAYGG